MKVTDKSTKYVSTNKWTYVKYVSRKCVVEKKPTEMCENALNLKFLHLCIQVHFVDKQLLTVAHLFLWTVCRPCFTFSSSLARNKKECNCLCMCATWISVTTASNKYLNWMFLKSMQYYGVKWQIQTTESNDSLFGQIQT